MEKEEMLKVWKGSTGKNRETKDKKTDKGNKKKSIYTFS